MAEYSCLVVEDSPMMRQLLVFALARIKKLHVTEAEDGVDGLRKLANGKFDLVITDISMPWMNGLQALYAARTAGVDTPVIVMTAMKNERIPAQVAAAGKTVLLQKPFDFDELAATVGRLLDERGSTS